MLGQPAVEILVDDERLAVSVMSRRANPLNGSTGLTSRSPRSIPYGNDIVSAVESNVLMSTVWASKISAILSPTRSYIDCMSRFAARPCWTLLMIASSAARSSVSVSRRFVSSNSRAFSSATLRLDGERRQEAHVRVGERVLAIEVLERDDAADLVADDQRREQDDFGVSPWMAAGWPSSIARSMRDVR